MINEIFFFQLQTTNVPSAANIGTFLLRSRNKSWFSQLYSTAVRKLSQKRGVLRNLHTLKEPEARDTPRK